METREKISEAARRQNNCPKCGGIPSDIDGDAIGGMPGITYRYCNGCGWSQAKAGKKPKPEKL